MWQWYALWLENHDCYDRRFMCVIPVPGVRVAGCGELACVGFVACNSACVSECIMALCMIISNDSTIPPWWLLLLICRGEIISFHVSRNKNLCFCECAIPFPLLYFELVNHVSILPHWRSNKAVFNCVCVWCQDCLNYTKGSNFWKQKHNWHPAENPLSSMFVLGWAWSIWHFSM